MQPIQHLNQAKISIALTEQTGYKFRAVAMHKTKNGVAIFSFENPYWV
jgi:hypothetical protein